MTSNGIRYAKIDGSSDLGRIPAPARILGAAASIRPSDVRNSVISAILSLTNPAHDVVQCHPEVWGVIMRTPALAALFICGLTTEVMATQGKWARSEPFQVADNTAHPIPLQDNGSDIKTFNLVGGGKDGFVLEYGGECMVQGPTGSKLTITILIDGKPTKPDSGTAFCSSTSPDQPTYMSVIRRTLVKVTAGPHSIQVVGTGIGTTLWQVQDTVLTVS